MACSSLIFDCRPSIVASVWYFESEQTVFCLKLRYKIVLKIRCIFLYCRIMPKIFLFKSYHFRTALRLLCQKYRFSQFLERKKNYDQPPDLSLKKKQIYHHNSYIVLNHQKLMFFLLLALNQIKTLALLVNSSCGTNKSNQSQFVCACRFDIPITH